MKKKINEQQCDFLSWVTLLLRKLTSFFSITWRNLFSLSTPSVLRNSCSVKKRVNHPITFTSFVFIALGQPYIPFHSTGNPVYNMCRNIFVLSDTFFFFFGFCFWFVLENLKNLLLKCKEKKSDKNVYIHKVKRSQGKPLSYFIYVDQKSLPLRFESRSQSKCIL